MSSINTLTEDIDGILPGTELALDNTAGLSPSSLYWNSRLTEASNGTRNQDGIGSDNEEWCGDQLILVIECLY